MEASATPAAPHAPKTLEVIGCLDDPDFHRCRALAARIDEANEDVTVSITPLFECDYLDGIPDLKLRVGQPMERHTGRYVVLMNGQYVGDCEHLMDLAVRQFHIMDAREVDETKAAEEAAECWVQTIEDEKRSVCQLTFNIDGDESNTLWIDLYHGTCPKATKSFSLLCSGANGVSTSGSGARLHYKGCPVHRVVPGGWVQSGDIIDGSGGGGECAFGGLMEDESFSVSFDRRGIVGLANDGAQHTNGSQFFITFAANEWMDTKRVGVGRVLRGYDVLDALENLATENDRPKGECFIASCDTVTDFSPYSGE